MSIVVSVIALFANAFMLENYEAFTTIFNATLVDLVDGIMDLAEYEKGRSTCDVDNGGSKRVQ